MKFILISGILLFVLILLTACPQKEENDNNGVTPPSDMPPIPVPAYVGESLPEKSEEITLGIGKEIDNFSPYVEEIKEVAPGVGYYWHSYEGVQPPDLLIDGEIQCIGIDNDICITEIPRIKHTRYWKKVFSVAIDESASYSEMHSITYGVSETKGQEFSVTIGGEVSAWFVTVSTEISNSVSYEISSSTETTIDKEFSCDGTEGKITVFTVWQLVDRFSICNSNGEEVTEENKTLFGDRIRLAPIESIEEVSDKQFYLSTVLFDK